MTMFTSSQGTVGANGPRQGSYDTQLITTSDTVDLVSGNGNNRGCLGFSTGTSGNVSVNLTGGGTAVFTGLAANQRVLCPVTRILATGTTSTGVMALY